MHFPQFASGLLDFLPTIQPDHAIYVAAVGAIAVENGIRKAVKALKPAIKRKRGEPIVSPFTAIHKSPEDDGAVEIVADACVRLNRRMGAVHIAMEAQDQVDSKKRSGGLALADALQRRVRSNDQVSWLDDRRIIVWVSMLQNCNDLESIARRLAQVASDTLPEGVSTPPVGCAVHPLDGYAASELIDAARQATQHAVPMRH
jgi:hypothetical protein